MKHATPDQLNEIYSHFYKTREWFPHIRKDYLCRMIESGNVIYQQGVIIIYKRYKRKNRISEKAVANKGDIMLHQILNTKRGSKKASAVLRLFFLYVQAPVWLTVRRENEIAVNFYRRQGMEEIDTTSWMNKTLPGLVFRFEL